MNNKTTRKVKSAFVGPIWFPEAAVCRCGCGKRIKSLPGHRKRQFAGEACRTRHMRSRKAAAGLTKRSPWKVLTSRRTGRRGKEARREA